MLRVRTGVEGPKRAATGASQAARRAGTKWPQFRASLRLRAEVGGFVTPLFDCFQFEPDPVRQNLVSNRPVVFIPILRKHHLAVTRSVVGRGMVVDANWVIVCATLSF